VFFYIYTGIYQKTMSNPDPITKWLPFHVPSEDFVSDDHLFHAQMFKFAEVHAFGQLRGEALRYLWMSLNTLDGKRDTICVSQTKLSISDQDKLSNILEALEEYEDLHEILRMGTRILQCIKHAGLGDEVRRFYLEGAFVPMLAITSRKEDPKNICFDCRGRWMLLAGCTHEDGCKVSACTQDTICEACYGKPTTREQVTIV
jgi:hypothetical protein